jgi:hypothetical protein
MPAITGIFGTFNGGFFGFPKSLYDADYLMSNGKPSVMYSGTHDQQSGESNPLNYNGGWGSDDLRLNTARQVNSSPYVRPPNVSHLLYFRTS